MWRWFLVALLVHLNFISSQPVINENDRSHSNIECCPCPKDQDTLGATRNGAFMPGVDWPDSSRAPFEQDQLADTTRENSFIRSGNMDDCPCRLRDADSTGAASILFPSAVRALWPVVSETNEHSKEDPKPLLHPEVDFASSVLETLRQVTDEEYEDALARDAARSVMKAADLNPIDVNTALDAAKNIVDVIFNPDDLSDSDDGLQEASHVQESRCIFPLGINIERQQNSNPSTLLNEIVGTPKQKPFVHRNLWDMDSSVEASNVNDQIINNKNIVESLNLKSNPSLFNLFRKNQNKVLDSNNAFVLRNSNIKPLLAVDSKPSSDMGKHVIKNKFSNSPLDLKFKLDQTKNLLKDNPLSNILQKQDIESKLKLNPLFTDNKFEFTTMKPFPFKSLLKLKDVELVPPVIVNTKELNKASVNTPQVPRTLIEDSDKIATNLFKTLKSSDLSNILNNGLKLDFINKGFKPTNIQSIPNDNTSKSKIMDSVTSPSELKVNYINNSEYVKIDSTERMPKMKAQKINQTSIGKECKVKNQDNTAIRNDFQGSNMTPFKKTASTEILDTEPSASETHNFEEFDPHEINHNSIVKSQPIQNDTVNEKEINSHEDFFSNEDIQDEKLDNEDYNNSEDKEDEARNQDESSDSDKIQVNCPEAKVKIQDFITESSGNTKKSMEAEEIEADGIRDTDSNEHMSAEDGDSLPETSNNIPNVIQSDKKQKGTSNSSPYTTDVNSNESSFSENSRSDNKVNINPQFQKSNKLSSLTENILKQLNNLSKNIKKVSKTEEDAAQVLSNDTENEALILDDCEDENATSITEDRFNDKEQIYMKDLQNMSDKLLHLSSKRDQETSPLEVVDCENESSDTDLKYNQFEERSHDKIIDGNNNGLTDHDNIDMKESKKILDDLEKDDSISDNNNMHEKTDDADNIDNKNELCLEASANEIQSSLVDKNPVMMSSKRNGMTVAASDTFENRIKPINHLKSPLPHDILYYKTPKNDNHQKETSLDNSEVLSLPKLEDISQSLSNIYKQPKSNIDFFSMNQQQNRNEIDSLVEADTPTLKLKFPPLEPLQDVDLDFFQLKPFTLKGSPILSKIPRLNLNSYKAKLAIPKSIDIKPMKLTSSLGDKNGLFGATLTIGSDKISPFGETPTLLGNHFDNLPSLEGLRTTLRENAQNLLVTPIQTTGRNIIEDTLRSGQTISDNIRSHTKTAVKNIQQTLETRLQDVRENDLLGDSRNPQEFLEAVARKHEDLTDKLKGIQYDLNDRLETFRDNFIVQPILPPFSNPIIKQRNGIYKPERNFQKSKDLFTSSNGKKTNSQFTKKSSIPKIKYQKTKTFKMPTASSVLVPKTIEGPKLKSIPAKSSLLNQSSSKTPQLLSNKKSISELLREPVSRFQNSKIPVLSRPRENKKNKIKISFSTTPRPDFSTLRDKPIAKSSQTDTKSNYMLKKTDIQYSPKLNSRLRPLNDANGSPSEVSTSKVKSPLSISDKSMLDSDRRILTSIDNNRQFTQPKLTNKLNPTLSDSKRFVDGNKARLFPSMPDKSTLANSNKLLSTSTLKSAETPKNIDILSSLREAVRARLSNVSLTTSQTTKPNSLDMTKSASENFDNVSYIGKSMKENTSYTCRMMCSRNE